MSRSSLFTCGDNPHLAQSSYFLFVYYKTIHSLIWLTGFSLFSYSQSLFSNTHHQLNLFLTIKSNIISFHPYQELKGFWRRLFLCCFPKGLNLEHMLITLASNTSNVCEPHSLLARGSGKLSRTSESQRCPSALHDCEWFSKTYATSLLQM